MTNVPAQSTPRAGAANLRWLLLSAGVIAADQITKYLASTYLLLHDPVAILPGFNLTLVHNTGVAFSFLAHGGDWTRWFLVILAVVVSLVIVVWLTRLPAAQTLAAVALALILGGAVGNVWDRIQYGYVVDFVDVYYGVWHWPAFNVADSAIMIGAALLIVDTLRPHPREPST